MQVIITENKIAASKKAFSLLQQDIAQGATVLGLATGSTPVGLYDEICASELDCSALTAVNLDEYVGIAPTNPQSYHHFMHQHLFSKKPFKQSFIPDGTNRNADEVIAEYNQVLADHPIDTQILGIGQNGHIGFNEPGTPFDSQTHKVQLTASTIAANARFFASPAEVPSEAYTMGIGSIMQAKHIILMAFGEQKAAAIAATVDGEVTPAVPASVLQTHPNATIIIDRPAASQLR
ncbi:glucosamine-6-phosphate deaminase [Limosilactobacillus caccae]|uniref:glucosamine-6-phosphate deaminase n=1 Tax=Limosilactobacillus caccae TaxID=1926284 RepID=UPI0009708B18|nr:glucosamine-6-phosphate deaminase [Limosilactobacillus caccae]